MKRTASNGYGWHEPRWRSDAVAWARAQLSTLGISVTGAYEQPHARPWSTVFRFPTDAGPVWFKAAGPGYVQEAALVDALARWGSPHVLTPLAVDPARGWLLSPDAGTSLREVLEEDPDLGHWERALHGYGRLQRDLAQRAGEMLSLGLPDSRPRALAAHLGRLLEDPAAIGVGEEHGLSAEEHAELGALLPRFAGWCERLEASSVDPTVQHDDLHDESVFVRDGKYVFLDWADACVAHPFGSLIYPLRLAAEAFGLGEDAPELARLRDGYLALWDDAGDVSALADEALLAIAVNSVGRVLAWQRAVVGVPPEELDEYAATGVTRWFRRLLSASRELP